MKAKHWPEIARLYQACVDLPPDERSGFLADACADGDIRREVESLLAHRARGLSFIERPALDVAAGMAAHNQVEPLVGRTLGRYEVTSLCGAGGMGVVYRARDTRLGRDVALKLLPGQVSDDPGRQVRAEHEARLLASLNHPNIAAIYDLDDSIRCLVLEFVEGETLAARMKRGRIPLSEALNFCRQIAEALEAAHEQGVVHRDLKPANVMLTPNGSVKVLDFGIATILGGKATSTSPVSGETSGDGVILGTPSYMSPEQARGQPADKRTDIWAFGCVLYEVLAGRKAYEKETVTDTLAAIVEREPDWSALPKGTPPAVVNLLRRCLQKDPRWRLRDIGDARIELADDRREPHSTATAAGSQRSRLWMAGIGVLALVAALVAVWRFRPVAALGEMRLEITTPPSADLVSLAIAPDGNAIAYVSTHEGRSRLWFRSLASTSSRPLAGTDGASCPFWSPDAASIGFFADGKLKRIDVETGSIRALATALSCGGTWNGDGTILFASPMFGPISRVPAAGGEPANVTRLTLADRPGQTSHRFPQFLPDGRHFLYYAGGNPEGRGIYVTDLAGSEPRRLIDADTAAVYQSSGHLLFVRQGQLFAQGFDPARLTLIGTPGAMDAQVAFDPARYIAAVSASSTGVLVYRPGSAVGRRQFVWLDRFGNEIEKVGDPDLANPLDPALSPDEHQVALYRTVNGRPDIWLLDVRRPVLNRFTYEEITGPGAAIRPMWSPDGGQIVFSSLRKHPVTNLFRRSVTGGTAELLLETDRPKAATDWSTDGRFILYRSEGPTTMTWDIWALPIDRNGRPGTPVEVARTSFDETNGQFSPDSKWVAYQSNETGRFEIYVQPFPGPGRRLPVSRNGGAQVRWRRDGKELFYVGLDDRLMAVPIQQTADGQPLSIGAPVPLFATRMGGAVKGADRQQYMPSSDGQRFLVNAILEEPTSPITVLLNWKANPR